MPLLSLRAGVLFLLGTALIAEVAGNCGPPPVISNVVLKPEYMDKQEFPENSRVVFTCEPGYLRSRGVYVTYCRNGKWTVNLKCERKSCGSSEDLMNGYFEYEGILFGDKAHAVCNEGFHLVGKGYRTCLANGQWEDYMPLCEVSQCPEPPEIPNAEIITPPSNSYSYSTVVIYRCISGQLIGNKELVCDEAGNWTGTIPECKEVNCPNTFLPNGRKTAGFGPFYRYGDSVSFACNSGYELQGSSMVSCQQNSQWAPSIPTCIKTSCPSPPDIEHAHPAFRSGVPLKYTKGVKINYECDQGYIGIGESRLVNCTEQLEWTKPKFICLRNCGPPPKIANGKFNGKKYTYRSEITYTCIKGFTLVGQSMMTCTQNGWSSRPPYCKGKCPMPFVPNAYLKPSQGTMFTVGTKLVLKCHSGYEVEENQLKITCLPNLTWSDPGKVCQRKSCGHPPEVQNAKQHISGTRFNDTVLYTCHDGYKPKEKTIRCKNKGWEKPPVCTLKRRS
ncbi:sushi, von Willebrand factor type A, EGF and pentraxin domain-containing protein 1-like isoform X2 [Erpetoichthys calabaricus]|uniref:sushi, von Willebrand factor type A, EGF and pentraxin domain-containing protein 1-like isoform X2 n=1 Tax=Erpetoichthys calabaricus TaxID=27687 RepID=UPI0022345122|nr:sushi, von Willebrand factor type A, EGF and pentraxin domain-containing protein 1-like isoform X2 [Erpetoichthys calabaricus]